MHANQPSHFRGIESRLDIHERLQHLYCRNRHDGGEQFLLQPAEMDSGHPVRPVRVAAGIDFRDEILDPEKTTIRIRLPVRETSIRPSTPRIMSDSLEPGAWMMNSHNNMQNLSNSTARLMTRPR